MPKGERKKRVDYRAWANRHFKDPTSQLPPVYTTGYNSKKYVPPVTVKPKKKARLYRIEFSCNCGHTDIYDGHLQTMIKYLRRERVPACVRCTNFMNVRGILENIFVVLYIKILCLLKTLRKS
jgi:hypothetical protein